MKEGEIAGCINGTGYRQIAVDGKIYNAHRLVWLYIMGVIPECDIDHINGIRVDNRISNLRLASRSENLQNIRGPRKDNKSGYLGVHFDKVRKAFIAKIMIHGVTTHLGYFNTASEAGLVYLDAKRRMHSFSTL